MGERNGCIYIIYLVYILNDKMKCHICICNDGVNAEIAIQLVGTAQIIWQSVSE